ncbi:hypothetical protein BDN72DRAFT_87571 [Pluteus cervinus]|uniref:Uncharacterized protein n=1 Tax=Pluteus cervinus TaxID=181527 RepID=A0ACD3AQ08_9AGAR|nr:hypothetical protein BDN72DRAFT_87571 [Pluteus cervinus]
MNKLSPPQSRVIVRSSGIMALPAEVLLVIMRLEYASLTEWTMFPSPPRRPLMHSEKIFPYSIATVCKTWDFVASMAPEFWSLVVIFLESTSLSYAEEVLLRSKDLPIEVHILENKPLDCMDPPSSFSPQRVASRKSKMQQLIATITPHLRRCERLVIQVVNRDLLPCLNNITAPAPELTRLVLEAKHHEHSHVPANHHHSQPILFIPSSNLYQLAVDGVDWYPGFQSQLNFGTEFHNLTDLTISNLDLSTSGRSSHDAMDEFVGTLGSASLSVLRLARVRAGVCYRTIRSPPTQLVELRDLGFLKLADCESHFLWSFLSHVSLPCLDTAHVVRCLVDAMPVAPGCELILEEIEAGNDLGGFLGRWEGISLTGTGHSVMTPCYP